MRLVRWPKEALAIALSMVAAASPAGAQLVADLAAPGRAFRLDAVHAVVAAADGDGFVPVHFQATGEPAVDLVPDAAGWNLSSAGELRLHLQNAMPWPVTVDIRLTDLDGSTLDSRLGLPPGGPLTLTIPLQATQPRRWGMVAGPPIPWLEDKAPVAVALTTAGRLDKSRIAALRIAMPRPVAPQTLRIGKAFLQPQPASDLQERLAYAGIVDAYGQYTRGGWEEKFRPADSQDDRADAASGAGGTGEAAEAAFARFVRSQEMAPMSGPGVGSGFGAGADEYGGLFGPNRRALTAMPLARSTSGPTQAAPEAPRPDNGALTGHRGEAGGPAGSGPAGFFRTAKAAQAGGGERWLLLTPLGNPFFSLGVNAIQLDNSQTFVEGREFMFTELPQPGDPLVRFRGRQDSTDALPAEAGAQRGRGYGKGATFDFYRANLYRRDGEAFRERWLERTRERLRQWNFNTIASWSDLAVSDGARIPYTRTIHVAGDFGRLSDGSDWWSGIPDAFDPRFGQALERTFAEEARPLKDDPYLIGYFVDNELGWGHGSSADPMARYALAYSALRSDARDPAAPGAPAKRAFLASLRDRYDGSIERLAATWRRPIDSWRSLEAPMAGSQLPDGRLPEVAGDLADFLRLHAERYFSQVSAALDRHDPNHLYLGARFASRTPEALAACARWCDVLSFNLYLPTLDAGFEAESLHRLGKPALLTEFHFGSTDRGPFWPGLVPVPDEAGRGPAYERLLNSVLANPDFVGAHWFQYLDQPVTGRWLDGENGHFGLVAITDIPWKGFVSDVRRTNAQILAALRERLQAKP